MKNSGVKFVIDNIFNALEKYSDNNLFMLYDSKPAKYRRKGVKTISMPSIGYDERIFSSKEELDKRAEELKDELQSKLDLSRKCVIHCHNVNLMKNSYLGRALQMLADELDKKITLIMQVHDFAEDNRAERLKLMQNATGEHDIEYASKLAYPTGKNILYCTINSRDKKILTKAGIKRIFLFANNIDIDFLSSEPKTDGLKEKLKEYALKKRYKFDSDRKILLSPLKIIKRKNVIETLLILKLLNRREDNWQLLITLDANSKEDKKHSAKIKKYVKKYKLPVTIGFGYEFISPSQDRTGKYPYNMRDLFEISDAIITTSKHEGFGMSYIEGWVTDTPVVGRRIDFIFKDFENKKIDLSHFYRSIMINSKDFKDLEDDIQLRIINREIILKDIERKKPINKLLRFIENPDKEVINKNKDIIKKEFSLKSYFSKIKDMLDYGTKRKSRRYNVDTKVLVRYFR